MLQMVTRFLGFEFLVWEIQQSLLKCESGFCWFLVGLVVPVAFVGLWLSWVVPMAVRFIITNVNKN